MLSTYAAYAPLGKACPHASIDSTGIRVLDDQRPERARLRRQDRGVVSEGPERGVKAERSEPITRTLESRTDVCRSLQTWCGEEAATKVHAGFAERIFPAASGELPDQERDQVGEVPFGELDGLELRRDFVELRWAAGAGSTPRAATFERNGQESGLRQSIEPAARDVSMNAERGGRLVRSKPFTSAACIQKNPAKLGVAGRCEAVERHSGKR
jgi:hypothetical protein